MSDLLNTQEYEFNPDAVESIDQDSVEGGGPSYPLIQWAPGDMKAKKYGGPDYLGGFFIKADKIDGATLEAAGWTKTSRTFRNGADEEGYWKREAALSIIAARHRIEISPENGQRQTFPWDSYEKAKAANGGKNPVTRVQFLVLVKGLEAAGPFVLTLKTSARAAFESLRDPHSVFSRFNNTVISAANDASIASTKKKIDALKAEGKSVPAELLKKLDDRWAYRAFWLPCGANRNEKGEPIYKEVGSPGATTPVVLPIALGLPDKAAQVELKRFYVGPDLLATVNALFDQSAEWRTAWDKIQPGTVEGNGADTPAAVDTAASEAEAAALAATGL